MKTWLYCESSIHAETKSNSPRNKLIQECTECARTCFAVVSKLVSTPGDLGDLPFNCLLHCRQCYEECIKYENDEDIAGCGEICLMCADMVKEIVVIHLN